MSKRRFAANSARNHASQSSRRRRSSSDYHVNPYESLEQRTLLCGASWHVEPQGPVIEERPDLVGKPADTLNMGGDPANIVWTNRGAASDGFAARFGTMANQARAVVDAVIDYYELMIGSFNYGSATNYSLTLSMGADGSGFGASAGLATSLAGKPRSGSITMGAGNADGNANSDNGWFLDPTPYDNSEFMGNIVNAFAGDAQAGSPAFNKGDFFTVVAAEMTHCMGLFGNALAGWSSHTTNTGVADTSEGGGIGTFWTFNGPSINHLLTSNNGGGGGGNWGSAVHGAGPGVNVPFGPFTYVGAQDQGNAVYEFGRRYMVNNTFSLMFKDAYNYSSINPARFGTFYSSPFQAADGIVRVRGGTGASNDHIEIFRSAGNTITVAVNVGNDVPGTGALAGAGDLPAFTSIYDVGQVSQIIVDAGDGNDTIVLDDVNFDPGTTVAEPITINAGNGNDTLIVDFFNANLDSHTGAITFNGGAGTDDVSIYDNAATFSDTYTLTSAALTRTVFAGFNYSGAETLFLNAESGNNTFNINSIAAGTSWSIDGRDGNDTFNIAVAGTNAEAIDGNLTVTGNNGTDSVVYNDLTAAGTPSYTFNNNTLARLSNGTLTYNTVENLRLEASNGNNAIAMQTAPAIPPALIVNANDGADAFTIAMSDANPGFGGTYNGGNAADTMTVNDARANVFVGLHQDTFLGGSIRQHNYNTTESLIYNGAGGADTFHIYSTLAGNSMTVNGAAGNDTFEVGGILFNLSTFQGPLTVNGGANTDTVNFGDQSASAAHTYRLLDTQFQRDGMATMTYGGGTNEIVKITAGAFNDNIDIVGHDPVSTVTVDAAGGALDIVQVNSDGAGLASVHFANTQDLSGLDIQNGGTLIVDAGGNKVIDTDTLTFVGSGKLDLNDNDMIIDYTGATVRAAIQNLINTGRAGGAWTGNGITSTSAKTRVPKNTTLGVLEATQFQAVYGPGAAFAGRTIDTTAILVKYTYYGDADFSGTVSFDDYSRTDLGYALSRFGWFNGDYDGSGTVNFDDYSLMDLAFNTQSGTL